LNPDRSHEDPQWRTFHPAGTFGTKHDVS
jgi:hypothetical protein